MQELVELLQSLGLDFQSGDALSSILGGDVAGSLATQMGLGMEAAQFMPGTMFPTITKGQEGLIQGKAYSPLLEAKGETLLDKLFTGYEGQQARKAYGNFASTSASDIYGRKIGTEYYGGMTSALGDINKQRSQALSNITDLISTWRDTAAELT